jgi:acyl carrier protein
MMKIEIEERVRQFVLTSFLADSAPEGFRNDDDLFVLLDSLQILRLVVQIESMFGIKVEQQELSAENLSSVQRIAAFVPRKCGGRVSHAAK